MISAAPTELGLYMNESGYEHEAPTELGVDGFYKTCSFPETALIVIDTIFII